MEKQPLVMRKGEASELEVMGAHVRFLCEAGNTGNAWSLMECELPNGSGPPPHDHAWDEAYYITAGEVTFTIGRDTVTVKAGDFIYAPGGTLHGFRATSEQPARMLIVDVPAHAESFFKDVDREVKDLPRDLAKVPAIGERHGIHFRPPA